MSRIINSRKYRGIDRGAYAHANGYGAGFGKQRPCERDRFQISEKTKTLFHLKSGRGETMFSKSSIFENTGGVDPGTRPRPSTKKCFGWED